MLKYATAFGILSSTHFPMASVLGYIWDPSDNLPSFIFASSHSFLS